jgi:hypothetical protein
LLKWWLFLWTHFPLYNWIILVCDSIWFLCFTRMKTVTDNT